MKCPKCEYLGFDTGDRCKNCGYDFSLVSLSPETPSRRSSLDALDSIDLSLALDAEPSREPQRSVQGEPTPSSFAAFDLPLFTPPGDGDDEPLIKMPAAPRAPLSVRRTPETPRLRAVTRQARRPEPEPELELQFADDPVPEPSPRPRARQVVAYEASGPGRRLLAAAVDVAILLGIDVAVVYFTLKMAALPVADWQAVPAAPLVIFLAMLKLAYFCAFTAVGGQTIGKMAAGIRVVGDDNSTVDLPRAARRTLAGSATLGLAFVPALLSADGRALHDRVARTRVVALPAA